MGEWNDPKTIYTIIHVFGAVLGAGGAYLSDAMFFHSIKDKVISSTEIIFLKLGSVFVWVGLGVLIISGVLLFSTDPAGYMSSSKFLIKMFVVLVILVNGIFFHRVHLPRIGRHANHHYPSSDEFIRNRKFLAASGAVSMTSWTTAIILGSLPSIPLSFAVALTGYLVLEITVVVFALVLARKLL